MTNIDLPEIVFVAGQSWMNHKLSRRNKNIPEVGNVMRCFSPKRALLVDLMAKSMTNYRNIITRSALPPAHCQSLANRRLPLTH